MDDFFLNRIRILKTGVSQVERYLDMGEETNRLYFEQLAQPGTQLKLRRVHDHPEDPFRIEVFSPDNRYLGRVTVGKNETAARLMDAGCHVIAIVNESLPIHESDTSQGMAEYIDPKDPGWNEGSRCHVHYTECNLPFSIYLVED